MDREEGVPPYVILTNRELRAIIEKRPEIAASPAATSQGGRQGATPKSKDFAGFFRVEVWRTLAG